MNQKSESLDELLLHNTTLVKKAESMNFVLTRAAGVLDVVVSMSGAQYAHSTNSGQFVITEDNLAMLRDLLRDIRCVYG